MKTSLIGLNESQIEGRELGLSRADVETPNFGPHTLRGIAELSEGQEADNTARWAFEQLKGLNSHQVQGKLFGLPTWQVRADDFGQHTVDGMVLLMKHNENLPVKEAYKLMKGLDEQAVTAMLYRTLPGWKERISRERQPLNDEIKSHVARLTEEKMRKSAAKDGYVAVIKGDISPQNARG